MAGHGVFPWWAELLTRPVRRLIPAARTLDSSVDCRAAGISLISRAAATPTLRAYQSALRAAGIMQDPAAIVAPYVHAGMTVLEPGPGMGFFTLELAHLVRPAGRVIASTFNRA